MAAQDIQKLLITSSAFENEGAIPSRFTCDGESINPPLKIDNIPDGTVTLAIIVEDPDAPDGTFDHWLVWNIPLTQKSVHENSNPGTSGNNSAGKTGFHGPCPPSGSHRYYFNVFAIDGSLDLLAGEDKTRLLEVMEGHVLATGSLMGRYEKSS